MRHGSVFWCGNPFGSPERSRDFPKGIDSVRFFAYNMAEKSFRSKGGRNMKQIWSLRWKKLLIWVCGYLSIVAFALVGGYTIVRSDSRALKQTSQNAFIVVLIFTALSALGALLSGIGSVSSGMGGFLAVYSMIVTVSKIVVFAVCAVVSFFRCKEEPDAEGRDENESRNPSARKDAAEDGTPSGGGEEM